MIFFLSISLYLYICIKPYSLSYYIALFSLYLTICIPTLSICMAPFSLSLTVSVLPLLSLSNYLDGHFSLYLTIFIAPFSLYLAICMAPFSLYLTICIPTLSI